METKEMNRLNMQRTVFDLLQSNRSTIQANRVLLERIDEFGAINTRIEKLNNDYLTISKGVTSNKDRIKALLAKATDQHCGELHNLGDDTGDNNLQAQSKVSVSILEKLPNTELLLKAQGILTLLKTHAATLVDYDISAEEITIYEALVNSYDTALKTKETRSDDSSIARDQLTKAFSEATQLLIKIDKAMKKAEDKYPELYAKFVKARAITDIGTRHETEQEEVQTAAAVSN